MTTPTTTAPPLPGLLYAQAAEYQDRLVALEDEAAAAMEQAWETARVAIQGDLDQLMARVEQARATGESMSPSWAMREARYRQALATVDEQVAQYAQTAARLAGAAQGRALELATTSAASLGSAAVAEAGVAATFQAVNPANLQHLVGFLQDGTPLADLFAALGPDAVAGARQVFTHGIVLGRGTDRIARDLQRVVDVPRWRSVTIARTESHRVFREASRQTYAQNAGVLEGWTWTAHLDSRCCPGCVAMHGTQHTVADTLDGHPRCRCAMVPRTRSWGDLLGDDSLPDTRPTIGRGTDWLRDQPARVQRAVLGPGKFTAWRAGELDLEDLVRRSTDSRWGTMRRESTLAEAKASALARKRAALAPARDARWDRWEQGRDVRVTQLRQVQFDPQNPLAVYGNRLNVADRSDVSAAHLEDLEKMSPDAHRVLADHFASRTDGPGFYVGDSAVPGLDDLGHLHGVQPRGWAEGQSWDNVPGAYDPTRRVCACGGGGKGHGSTSLALHEASHALDDALAPGRAGWGWSKSQNWVDMVDRWGQHLNFQPYFTKAGNPAGYSNEAFAEAHAAMTAARAAGATGDDVALAVTAALRGIGPRDQLLTFGRWVVDALDQAVANAARTG